MSASPKWIDSIHYELTKLKAINALVNAVAHAYSDEDVEPVDANEMFCNLAVVTDDVSERLTKIHDDATAMHDAWVRESKAGAKGDATGRAS